MNLTSAVDLITIVALVVLCLLCSFVTVFGFYFYGREIILSFGSADKSLLFWYLPFVLFGIIALKIALRAGRVAYQKIRMRGEHAKRAG